MSDALIGVPILTGTKRLLDDALGAFADWGRTRRSPRSRHRGETHHSPKEGKSEVDILLIVDRGLSTVSDRSRRGKNLRGY